MKIPPLACDSHMHVFGPTAQYPGAPTRLYTPSPMPFASYATIAHRLQLERVVLVQPSAYGTDNRCLLDTMRQHGHAGTMRGVVVIDPSVTDAELDAMHALGVRGVRLNLMTPRVSDAKHAEQTLEPIAGRIGDLGWHLQIYADPDIIAQIAPVIRRLRIPVVFDHMAGVRSDHGVGSPSFAAVLDLLAAGGCWVKLSGADIVNRRDDDFAAVVPYMRALIAANADRLVWGTDWPHLVHHAGAMGDAAPPAGYRPVSEPALLQLLTDNVPDEALLHRILVDNPQRLYAFPQPAAQ